MPRCSGIHDARTAWREGSLRRSAFELARLDLDRQTDFALIPVTRTSGAALETPPGVVGSFLAEPDPLVSPGLDASFDAPAAVQDPAPTEPQAPLSLTVTAAPVEAASPFSPTTRTTSDGVLLETILSDRPDVFRSFFDTYYSASTDHHSPAWQSRVGGATPEDYANYWYETHGRAAGYQPGVAEPGFDPVRAMLGDTPADLTTFDGVLIADILEARPDVFRAFFTEFHGPNNDQRSPAWDDRVGGHELADYVNHWWEIYGEYSGYTPTRHAGASADAGLGEPGAVVLAGQSAPPTTSDLFG